MPASDLSSIEISHDQENVINSVQTFLRKFNRYLFFEMPKVLLLDWDRVSKIKDAFENKQYKPDDIQELFRKLLDDLQNIHEELAEFINSLGWNRHAVYDDDDDDVDYTIEITPVLSTEESDNSLSMGDEHLDTIPATESDEVIKSSVEDLVPILSESEGIPDTMCDVHLVNNPTLLEAKDHFEIVINSNDDYSFSDDDSLYYENIEYVEASTHDSELVSLEVKKIVIPEDEEIEDDNLREKLLKISSGSTTTHSDISLPEYEAFSFYDDHIEEISSGSTTTPSDNSLFEYDSFIFDLLNDQFPLTDRSDFTHEEFGDEPAHIISPSEYDCFYFRNLPDPGELISSLNSGIRKNLSSTTRVNLLVEDDYSPLLAYVVWIFLACLTYPVIPPHLHSFGNEDTIFDPGITINRFYSFKPGLSHRCGTFKKFNTHRSHLNESPMEMKPLISSRLATLDQPEVTMDQITQPERVLFNSRLKIFSGKLKSCSSGPFTISQVYPYGIVELSQPDGPNFKVNGHRLKHYFGEDVPNIPENVKTQVERFCLPVFIFSASIRESCIQI
nr:reverse transcriptase domain-containing protein [Tanacetum cinerariifolium]